MKTWKFILPAVAAMLFSGAAVSQTEDDEVLRDQAAKEADYTIRLREAEGQMALAARRIAELTSQRIRNLERFGHPFGFSNKPRIGVTIDGSGGNDAVDGVRIAAVTPEGAADDAGLRSGDVITAVNGEAMRADSSSEANKRLLDFMLGVEEGDELTVDYLRGGKARSADVSPRVSDVHAFAWGPKSGQGVILNKLHGMAGMPREIKGFRMNFGFPWAASGLGRMELVELNKGLGKYFGTDTGLLVVSVPQGDGIELQDGDVIQSIDGREPKDVRHAMRILSSYQSGEKLRLGIMRDKKKRTLEIEIPAHHSSSLLPVPPGATRPAAVVVPVKAPRAGTSTWTAG